MTKDKHCNWSLCSTYVCVICVNEDASYCLRNNYRSCLFSVPSATTNEIVSKKPFMTGLFLIDIFVISILFLNQNSRDLSECNDYTYLPIFYTHIVKFRADIIWTYVQYMKVFFPYLLAFIGLISKINVFIWRIIRILQLIPHKNMSNGSITNYITNVH